MLKSIELYIRPSKTRRQFKSFIKLDRADGNLHVLDGSTNTSCVNEL